MVASRRQSLYAPARNDNGHAGRLSLEMSVISKRIVGMKTAHLPHITISSAALPAILSFPLSTHPKPPPPPGNPTSRHIGGGEPCRTGDTGCMHRRSSNLRMDEGMVGDSERRVIGPDGGLGWQRTWRVGGGLMRGGGQENPPAGGIPGSMSRG